MCNILLIHCVTLLVHKAPAGMNNSVNLEHLAQLSVVSAKQYLNGTSKIMASDNPELQL
jgi:hypothetical protein